MKVQLHKALQLADTVRLLEPTSLGETEYLIEHRWFGEDDEALIVEDGNENQFTLPQQEIDIDPDGEAVVKALVDERTGETEDMKIILHVSVPFPSAYPNNEEIANG